MSLHFERETERLKKNILSLSALVEETVWQAVKSIKERDAALASWVVNIDVEIDQREVDIEEECLKVLALYQPVAQDLRFIIAVLKINQELERIGDATVNIAERSRLLTQRERIAMPFDFATMADKVQNMLRRSLDSLVNLDSHLAFAVIDSDEEVDALNREMYDRVTKALHEHPEHAESLIHLLGVSRHLERIGDHACNIAEDVIYMIESRIIRHSKEKLGPAGPEGLS
jgi:phosphate transport system protein